MIGWMPHSLNSVYAGVRFRCLYPIRTLRSMGACAEIMDLSRIDAYGTVVVQELLSREDSMKPYPSGRGVLRLLERMKVMGVRIVVDVCDNHFFHDRQEASWIEANAVFVEMVRLADHVIFSTSELSRQLQPFLSLQSPHRVIGDALETEGDLDAASLMRRIFGPQRWRARSSAIVEIMRIKRARVSGIANLVWFGSAGSSNATGGMDSLYRIKAILQKVSRELRPVRLTVISNSRRKYETLAEDWDVPSSYLEWDRTTFIWLLRHYDICTIPIEKNPFTIAKSNNRLLTALYCGLPVVADAIPSYEDFRFCVALDNWCDGLKSYLTDKNKVEQDVTAGQDLVSRSWSHEAIGRQWAEVLKR